MITATWKGNETDQSGYAKFNLLGERMIKFESFSDFNYIQNAILKEIETAKKSGREEILAKMQQYVRSL